MAKKSRIERNKTVGKLATFEATKKTSLVKKIKSLPSEKDPSYESKFKEAFVAMLKVQKMRASTKFRKRCAVTGKPRGFHGKFSLCRNTIREIAAYGLIPGLVKSSW